MLFPRILNFLHQTPKLFAQFAMCRPCCQKPVAKTNHCFVTMFGKLVKWGMISRCTHLATIVHLFTVSNVTSCTFQSVCICLHLSASIYLSIQPVRQTPLQLLQTVAYDNREMHYQQGSWSVKGMSIKGICLVAALLCFREYVEELGTRGLLSPNTLSGFAILSSCFLMSLKSFVLSWI